MVIPARDEEKNLAGVLESLAAEAPGLDLLVVDDGSLDGTAETARRGGAMLVRHGFNLGYGAAIQTGLKYAFAKGYRYAATFDGDGQHEAASLPLLLKGLKESGADLAVGNRFAGEGFRGTPVRRVGMVFFGTIASVITRRRISDPTSGFRAFNRRAMSIYCRDEFPDAFPDADALILLHDIGLKVIEQPVNMRPPPEGGGSMHAGHRSVLYVLNMILSIFFQLLRREQPALDEAQEETEEKTKEKETPNAEP